MCFIKLKKKVRIYMYIVCNNKIINYCKCNLVIICYLIYMINNVVLKICVINKILKL